MVHSRVRVGSRSIGAILAVCVVTLIVVPLWLVTFGRPPATFNEVLVLGAGFAFFAIIGWWAGRAAADRDWSQAVLTGFGLGVGWGPLGLAVAVIAFLVAIPLRGGQVGSLEEWLWGFSIVAVANRARRTGRHPERHRVGDRDALGGGEIWIAPAGTSPAPCVIGRPGRPVRPRDRDRDRARRHNPGRPMTAGIVLLFLVAPLIVVPLGLRSIERAGDSRRTDRLMRVAILNCSVPSAITSQPLNRADARSWRADRWRSLG